MGIDEIGKSESSARPKIIDIKVARLVAVQCIYSYQIVHSKKHLKELARDMVNSWEDNKYYKFTKSRVNEEYLNNILEITLSNIDKINADIIEFVSSNIQMERISKVVLAILQVAIAEIYRKELDFAIVINEYLNIATYLNYESQKGFINSILDKVAKKYL